MVTPSAPGNEMTSTGEAKATRVRLPESPHRGEFIAAAFGLDANRAAGHRCRGGCRPPGKRGQSGTGAVFGPVNDEQAALAVDEYRLRQPLIRMSFENATKDVGFRRPRLGAERRVEPLGEEGRAHIDLARPGAKREIPLEPQMLGRERDDADNRQKRRQENRRRVEPPGGRGARGPRPRAFSAPPGRRAHASLK